ncbi:hypothetical protein PUNSTDRAFT_82439 [Punctularia strigosozonata HHB-11173 SS5]|uniref:uncharacterized protein n=1 Tax=Punctularia strigosozonata (strain HHB-11173) TaxID=741275 RepID=UPI00044168D2|nr:uncharacterized protein PUNSTDRAFT_82439 [Punctularia strigosozonata HHB-11173 SS5]EIN12945.1 hypothetical protein PUNSTDRAFT_82439 [Punctularia strigosozonata HHB-11173 SS5]
MEADAEQAPFLDTSSNPANFNSSSQQSQHIARRLYISHFFSTWNSRLFEFGAVLFLAAVYPDTLLPASIYALVRAGAAIIICPVLGRYVDTGDRLQVVRFSILGQRASTILSCLGFLLLVSGLASAKLQIVLLIILAPLACVEKLCSIMNTVSVERDWVIVVAEASSCSLQTLNSQMRRIDLFCKLVGPLCIALLSGISIHVALLTTLILNIISVGMEYFAVAKVYDIVPALQQPKLIAAHVDGSEQRTVASRVGALGSSIVAYVKHRDFLPSFALSLLYLTVLSFGGQMVTYLLSAGFTPTHIGLMRAVSVGFEMSATWLAPRAMRKVGPIRAGLWFVTWQAVCLVAALSWYRGSRLGPLSGALGLVVGVIFSRVGLWGFDLCVQIIVQEEVEPEARGSFSSVEASFQNMAELLSYALTAVFSRPSQFHIPTFVSAGVVLLAASLYAAFVRRRRGHLIHVSSCISLKAIDPNASNVHRGFYQRDDQ